MNETRFKSLPLTLTKTNGANNGHVLKGGSKKKNEFGKHVSQFRGTYWQNFNYIVWIKTICLI